MKLFDISNLKLLLLAVNTFVYSIAVCQKLPSVQKEPMKAPVNVKIDGIPNEWDDAFKADNNSTDFKYLMANDADVLYIVIQTDYPGSAQKIVAGGITFTFSSADKKSQASLTYPTMPGQYSQGVSYPLRTPETTWKQIQDLTARLNDHIKEITVSGLTGITEPAVSLYNELGIKGAQYISDKRLYTIEFCLPLKYLQNVIQNGTFNYKMQVNGLMAGDGIVVGGHPMDATDQPATHGSANYLIAPTYLTSTYTLAK